MDEFGRESLKRCVAVVCKQETEFEGCTEQAVDALAEATGKYLEQMATVCHEYSNLSGRTLGSINDLLGMVVETGLFGSFSDLMHFRQTRFPAVMDNIEQMEQEESTAIKEEAKPSIYREWMADDQPEPLPTCAQEHMPPLPDRHSYKQSAVYVPRETDPGRVREISTQKNQFIQASLKKLIRTCDHSIVDILGISNSTLPSGMADTMDMMDTRTDEGDAASTDLLLQYPVIHYEKYHYALTDKNATK